MGLIDLVGYPEEAFAAARQMAGLSEARLVVYHPPRRQSIQYLRPIKRRDLPLGGAGLLSLGSAPRPMYMWLPEAPLIRISLAEAPCWGLKSLP